MIDKLKIGVILKLCNSLDAETVAGIFIRRFYRQHGLRAIIISDWKKAIYEYIMEKISNFFGIEWKFSTIHHL